MSLPFMSKFECWICGSTFQDLPNLIKHVRKCKWDENTQRMKEVQRINYEMQLLEGRIHDYAKMQETLLKILNPK